MRTWAGPAPRWRAGSARCCGLVPAGASRQITARRAGRILESVAPAGAVAAARWELAAQHAEDLRGIDARVRRARGKTGTAVRAAGASLAGIFGAGPVIAAAIIGDVRHISRFGDRGRFASCNGTAPVEVSSGGRKTCRLPRRGNRRLNHAIHMAAVTQIRCRHSKGRARCDKELAEGKTPEESPARAHTPGQRRDLHRAAGRRPEGSATAR